MDEPSGALLERAEAAYREAVADPTAARQPTAALVEEARIDGQAEPLVVALRALAWSERTLLAGERAKELLDEAAALARRENLEMRLGEVLVVRAAVNHELGRYRAAQRDLQQARPLLGSGALAELEHQTAVLHHNAGRLNQAAVIYRRVLSDPEAPDPVRAKISNNLAMIEAEFGHFDIALALLDQARALAREIGPAYTAYFTLSHATVLARAGLLPASLEMFEVAERLYDKAGLPRAELYTEYADALSDLWLLPEAMDAARRALEEWDVNHIPLMGAEAELRVARMAFLTGDVAAAERAAASAAEHFRRHERVGWAASADVVLVDAKALTGTATSRDLTRLRHAAHTLQRLQMKHGAVDAHLTAGRVAQGQERTPWALESFDQAKSLARRAPVLVRLKGRRAAASAEVLRGNRQRVLRECRDGLRDLEQHRGFLASAELRVLASGHGAELGRIGLRAVLGSGSGLDAFRWMERTRAAALLSVDRTLLDGYEEELARLRALQTAVASGSASAEEEAQQAELEARLRRLTWSATASSAGAHRPAFVSEIRDLLGDAILVEYGILDDQMFAVALTRRKAARLVDLGPLSAVHDELERLAHALRAMSLPLSPVSAARLLPVAQERLDRLRALLVVPLEVSAETPLVVVPVGILQRVPWAALHDAPVMLNPSAAFWVRARDRDRPSRSKALLAAGPGLTAASDEVRQIAELYEDCEVLTPPTSTVTGVTNGLADAALVHFACHGHLRTDNPMFSGLILSDGPLTVQELELRGLAPYRVVLAACEAAADSPYPGGETLGFVSALLARGTAGIVASTIAVPDVTATSLMVDVHQGLRDQPLAEALHQARGRLDRADPSEFVNWCGFVTFGAA